MTTQSIVNRKDARTGKIGDSGLHPHRGDFEDFHDVRYAAVDGDGIVEIFVDGSGSAEFAPRVYPLKDGQAVATAPGFHEGD